ncbi:MAG TPA: 4'-phosphopantetheinyl transferase superfamily protein [Pyrinomonadaceae bacterium]|jgi:4'-phosphopantetheinyl transferase
MLAPAMEAVGTWSASPHTLRLAGDEVHVWRASLQCSAQRVEGLLSTLTGDERGRADRFYFPKDRDYFIVARGLLREILSCYLGVRPHQLRFSYSSYGKPSLTGEFDADTLRFNLSHSHGLALFAITLGRKIGIDLERLRSDFEYEQIAERFFSAQEFKMLCALPSDVRAEAFFNCWTRKEAYIKARGEGLSLPLDEFDVALAPGEPAALLNIKDNPQEASRWSIRELTPDPGYKAAVAVEGHDWQLKCWQQPTDELNR